MNKLIINFQKNVNSITMFSYLINLILIALLFNNPIITGIMFLALFIMSILTRPEKIGSYIKFSGVIFLVTILFNLILNQRGTNVLIMIPGLRVTTESLLNGVILGLSFVNLLWTFYLYDALIRVKTVFELLSNLFKSIAIIFILTIKFIPEIIQIYSETQAMGKFRQKPINNETGLLIKIKRLISLNEIVLNKAIANFMNVSDTLILKGYEKRQKKLGRTEFKKSDWISLTVILLSVIFNVAMSLLHFGKIDFGSARLILVTKGLVPIVIINCLVIIWPVILGGVNFGWWKFYVSRTTVSDTITAKNYR